MLEKFKRIKLGHFPTPIEHLKNISQFLGGPNIFIKEMIVQDWLLEGIKQENLNS